MLVKTKTKRTSLIAEGSYKATVSSITAKPDEANQKKVIFGFKLEGHAGEVNKEVPFSFEEETMLRRDVETILGRQFTSKEAEEGFDLDTLVARNCQVLVAHKPGAGGKIGPVVALIQSLTEQA